MTPDDPRHGTVRGYRAHRKGDENACDRCKRAAAAAEARRHMPGASKRTTPDGVARRVQALVALGWTYLDIQRLSGIEDAELRRFALGERAYVFTRTVAKVDAAYGRLCMVLPPENTPAEKQARTKSRRMAARHGWVPPLAWDDIDDPDAVPHTDDTTEDRAEDEIDPAVVERLLSLRPIQSTKAEKVEAMRRWMASGRSQRSLCVAHGWQEGRYVARQDGAA